MSTNTELLQFLDGSLHPEQEAELLHRLSVSPERREMLRSFINQQSLFQRDRNVIAVPFAAEQKLWARLGQIMPVAVQNAAAPTAAVVETAVATASRTGIFSSVYSVASLVVLCLLIGLGSGFFVGKNSTNESGATFDRAINAPVLNFANSIDHHLFSKSDISFRTNSHRFHISGAPHTIDLSSNIDQPSIKNSITTTSAPDDVMSTNSALPQVSKVLPMELAASALLNGDLRDPASFRERSPFSSQESSPTKNFIQRFEFYFNEGIGKQFPNNTATNVSMPVVTNSSIAAYYQPLSSIPNLWIGATFGTANVTEKKFSIGQTDPLVANSQLEMKADLIHVQTSYIGGMLQYRIPISHKVAITTTATAASASLGLIYGGEVGIHYDATNDVGLVLGLRGTHFSYNPDAEQKQVIAQGIKDFGEPAAVKSNQPSYNVEISSGIYFHF